MLVAMALSIFVACSVKEKELALTFVSDEEQYATTIGIEQAKEILASQPTRDGYVFKGWYLDKGTWTQEVASANVEEIAKDNKTISVYAYWVEIVNKITVSFRDYNGGILLEKDYERTDDQLAKDVASLCPSKRPDDEKYTYTFDKWDCNTDDLTQGYFLATPIYTSELRYFEFNYYVDGELIYTDHVRYGENADEDLLAKPQKPSTEKYDYAFTGWEGNFNNITQDTDVHAKFQENIKKFDVTFNFGNNKSVTRKVEYGADAIAPSASEVVKPSTAQYTYTFISWDNSFKNIKQNTLVNANYIEQIRMYDVRFWVDGECIKYVSAAYGSSVEPPTQPIKNLNDGFTYEFDGWDKSSNNVVSNLDVHANFKKVSHTYTVDYVNWDGSLLFSEKVESGEPSIYCGDTPSRQSNDKYDYIFDGWTDEDKLSAITRNMTAQAKFKQQIKTFTVTFIYGDGKKSVFPDIEYGSNLTNSNLVPTDVAKASTAQYEYEFISWDGTFNNITSNTVISAEYKQIVRSYTVKFFVDDTCIKSVSALYGSSVEAPSQPVKVLNDGYTYEFVRWDKDFDNIVESIEVNAIFDKIANTFTVKYVNWDGTLLYTDSVESGGKSTYVGDTPTREPNDKYTYQFVGWTNTDMLDSVTQSFAAQAEFDEVVRTYTVTFNYGHGLQKVLEGIPYGTNLTDSTEIPTDTDKESTDEFDFTFIDWDKFFGYVSRDLEVNAIYKETIRKYIVTFINNGVAILTQEVEYGKYPTLPTSNIFKNHTIKWAFDFLGWQVLDVDTTLPGAVGDIDADDGTDYRDTVLDTDGFEATDPKSNIVKGKITYTAIYSRTIQQYTVKFYNQENDTEVLKEITVPWGTNAIEQAPTPYKESVPKWEYEFTNWSNEQALTKVESNLSVYADYFAHIRSYWVTYMNGDVEVDKFYVEYDAVSPRPDVIPTKASTLEYDFEFDDWDRAADRRVEGPLTINAVYKNHIRSYVVTLFNLATRELISTGEFAYGTKITTKIEVNGYDFDSWYRDPDCKTVFNQEEERVDGTMMLFGNIVMKGIIFNGNNEIVGYEGTQPNLVIPIAANGRKVTTIKEAAFKGNTVIGSVYIPNTITSVEAYVFSGLNLTESGGIYIQSEKKWYGTPNGWNQYWNRNSLTSFHESDRPVTYGVDGIYTVGDFQYILIADGGTAVVDKFINNNTAKAYITDQLDHQKAFFTKDVEVDKTGVTFDIYDVAYETNVYSIKQIAVSAFEGCSNVATIFIPDTISKVGNYAFSGVTANIYIQRSKPAVGEVPSGWGLYWNSNRSGQEGTRSLYWGVIDMDRVGVFSYIFMADGTAIAVEYNGSTSVTSVDVPGSVVFKDVTYTVTELGDELLANMTLLNTVTLNEGLKKIKSKVFYMDPMLSSVTLPSTLEEIGDYAFLGALALKEIYIPASVKTIGMLVFVGMDNLTIYCGVAKEPTYLPGISGYNPLWDVKLGLSDIGDLTNLKGIAGTIVNPNKHTVIYNVAAIYIDTAKETGRETKFKYVLFNNNTAKVISASNTILNVENYEMPSVITYNDNTYTVTAIGAGAFAGNTAIKTLIIPSTVTSIEENAFLGCSKLTIKTSHTSKPSGWNNNFNPDGRPVEYGYGVTVETETIEEVA